MATNQRTKYNANAFLPNLDLIYAAGLDPKTGLPRKLIDSSCALKENIKRQLRIVDEQNFVNRFKWYNLPHGINGNLLERILYYRGQCIIFYNESYDKFFCLPFTLNGDIDVYGRYTGVTPLPFNGASQDEKAKPWIPNYVLKPIYDVQTEPMEWSKMMKSCVILTDYTKQLPQRIIPRAELVDSLIDFESELMPFMRTALINNTGILGMRVNSADEQSNVVIANSQRKDAALNGLSYIPIIGSLDFQDMSGGNVTNAEEFLMSMQAVDNLRLKTLGLENGGIFQKKAHELESENAMNRGHSESCLDDALYQRQHFCDIFNSIFMIDTYCEPAETAVGGDTDMDGYVGDEEDQSGVPTPTEEATGGSEDNV